MHPIMQQILGTTLGVDVEQEEHETQVLEENDCDWDEMPETESDLCPECGDGLPRRNSCGEVTCENCGFEEGEMDDHYEALKDLEGHLLP